MRGIFLENGRKASVVHVCGTGRDFFSSLSCFVTKTETTNPTIKTMTTMISRRPLLKAGTLVVASAFASPHILRAQSPSARLQVGFIGTGPMGRSDCVSFANISDLVALCDLDEDYGLTPAMPNARITKLKPDTYVDYRRVLDRKDIDIVGIATRLGRELVWDAKAEKFVGDNHANTFLAREQRKNFEIPRVS